MDLNERRYSRFRVDHGTYCYMEGHRFDARALNLSPGGAFLQTADAIPVGMLVVVVLDDRTGRTGPVHLIGRVVRIDRVPLGGIALEWIRAVTTASREQLVYFLARALRVPERQAQRAVDASDGRATYHFDISMPRDHTPELPANVISLRRARAGLGKRIQSGSPIEFYTLRPDEAPPIQPDPQVMPGPSDPGLSRTEHAGPITRTVRRVGARVPLDVPIRLTVGRTVSQVRLKELGLQSMVVETDLLPGDPGAPLMVTLAISTREGIVRVVLAVEVHGKPDRSGLRPRLTLDITDVYEGPAPGIFERYLKWLHCRDVEESVVP